MDYWPGVRSECMDIGHFFYVFCLWTETESRSKNTRKKNKVNIHYLEQTSLVNMRFIFWKKYAISLRFTAGNPDILPTRVFNHSAGFGSFYPAHRVSHIMKASNPMWVNLISPQIVPWRFNRLVSVARLEQLFMASYVSDYVAAIWGSDLAMNRRYIVFQMSRVKPKPK